MIFLRLAYAPFSQTTSSLNSEGKRKLDGIAIALSGLCLIHCLAIPVAFLLGPVLSQTLVETETSVHWLLLGLAAPVSLWALGNGYRSHGKIFNLILGVIGLMLMLLGAAQLFGHEWEMPLTVIGVLAVLAAHVRNAISHLKHAV